MSSTLRTAEAVLLAALTSMAAQVPQAPGDIQQRDLKVRPLRESGKNQTLAVPRGYALIVGIGSYQKLPAEEFLKFSESDAEAIYRVLIGQQGGAFPAENVHRLIGPQATLQNLRHELEEWLPSVAQDTDRVVVYFAGHGLVLHGQGYLAPWDVDISHAETTAYPMKTLAKVLGEKVKARWKVLLADACHSQKINAETTDDAVDEQFGQLSSGFLTFTATRERESSYEDPTLSTGFGLFTYFLIQGLQGAADANCDGLITADEIIEYVREHVRDYARARGVSQTPTERGDFEPDSFVIGVTTCTSAAPPPSLVLGSLTIETNLDDVEVYVDDRLVGAVAKGKPLKLPGLATGVHTVKGVRKGYQPDTKEVMVVPGQDKGVTLRIQYRLEHKPTAINLLERGEKLLFKRTVTFNPLTAYLPSHQTQNDLAQARLLFTQALKEESDYAQAAFDLAMTCQLLSDSKTMLDAFRNAIRIDPTYVEARVQFAGALVEEGDPDEAIRQLTEALRIEPNDDVAWSHLSRAYLDKGVWDRVIESADKAIALKPGNDQAYLWKADALRHKAADESGSGRLRIYRQAAETYDRYLDLTNFSSPAYEKFAYYFIGFGIGARRHADRQGVYAYQRNLAYMGLCDCQDKLGYLQRARYACQRAIHYDTDEPLGYFFLGNVYRDLFITSKNNPGQRRDYLVSARANYAKMIQINPDLDMSKHAKDYLEQIDGLLPKVK
jgi:tetratricopeptide (TPR) repeat protein